jgi:hypothetical protein
MLGWGLEQVNERYWRGFLLGAGLTTRKTELYRTPSNALGAPHAGFACGILDASSWSAAPSELYPFVFFSLRDHSNGCVRLLNTSTIFRIDTILNLCYCVFWVSTRRFVLAFTFALELLNSFASTSRRASLHAGARAFLSISLLFCYLRTLLRHGNFTTRLESIRCALFRSSRGCTPPTAHIKT